MTAEQFTYWLQGFMEISDPIKLGEKETQMIKYHLNLVFDKQTPNRTDIPTSTPFQQVGPPPNPYIDWTWKPNPYNPYTVTCTSDDLTDPNKKIC